MHIALVSQEYPPETGRGGLATQTYLKAHGLAALGHQIHVISHSVDGQRHQYIERGVNVIRIPGFDSCLDIATDPVRWLSYSVLIAAELASLHKRWPVDIVDFPEWGGEAYVHLLNRTPWNSFPALVHLHGPVVMFSETLGWPEPDSEFYRVGMEMESTSIRLADAVISSSDCSADWCARFHGLDVRRVPIVHLGVDIDLFHPGAGARNAHPTIVFAGKVARNKGVLELLEATGQIAAEHPEVVLRMLGPVEPELARCLQDRAGELAHPGLLELVGSVGHDELAGELARGHVFAAPSHVEGGPGLVYLEAMACGLPVVACEGSGASEVVTDGDNGLLVPVGNVDALAGALSWLLADRRRRQAMGNRARDFVVREAATQECVRRLESIYSQVTRGEKLER